MPDEADGWLVRWLDYVPLFPLAIAAAILGLSPGLPEPHLWHKLKLLATGQFVRSLDLADFLLHASLPFVLVLKLLRLRMLRIAARR